MHDENRRRPYDSFVRVAALLTTPTIATATLMLMSVPIRLLFLPLMPLVPIALVLNLFVVPGLNTVAGCFVSFLVFAATIYFLVRLRARSQSDLAYLLALVLGALNAVLLPLLVPYLA